MLHILIPIKDASAKSKEMPTTRSRRSGEHDIRIYAYHSLRLKTTATTIVKIVLNVPRRSRHVNDIVKIKIFLLYKITIGNVL